MILKTLQSIAQSLRKLVGMALPQNLLDALSVADQKLQAAKAQDDVVTQTNAALVASQAAFDKAKADALASHSDANGSATEALALVKQYFGL